MRLDDVNFHFIHHKDNKIVMNNFIKRVDRMRDSKIIPVAWDSEIKNKDMLIEFKNIPNSILASNVKSQEEAAKQIINKYL